MKQHVSTTETQGVNFLTVFGVMAVLTILAFGASLQHGFSLLDDRFLVVGNYYIRGLTLENIIFAFTHFDPELYIPLTFLSYQATYLFSGLNPTGYHLVNLLLHASNAALVTVIAYQISERRWISLLAGCIFCLHPLHTEAVVWVAGRKDLLSTLFSLLSITLYIQYRTTGDKRSYILTIVTLVLALLSKAAAMIIPIVLLLIDVGIEHRKINRQMFIEKLPHIVLSVIAGVVAWSAKTRIVHASSMTETILMAAKSTVFYLSKLFFPYGLTPLYPWNGSISLSSPSFFVPVIILVLLLTLAILLWKRERAVLAALLIFLTFVSPSFFNFHKGDSIFFAVDRYAYAASIALIILTTLACGSLIDKTKNRNTQRGLFVLIGVVVLTLGVLSWKQTAVWANDISVFERSVDLYPSSIPGHVSLAAAYREAGRLDDEERVLRNGMKRLESVSYYTALGSVYVRQKKFDEARGEYAKAMTLDATNPEPYFFLGSLLEEENKPDEALAAYKRAIELDDSYVSAYNNAGGILRDQKDFSGAEALFRKAVLWNPSFMEGEYNLFDVLEAQGKSDKALPHLEKAYALHPDSSDLALSLAYQYSVRSRRLDALRTVEAALAIDPENRSLQRLKTSIESSD